MSSSLIPTDLLKYEHTTKHFRFYYCYRSPVAALRDPHPIPGVSAVSLHGVHDFTYVRLLGEFFERAWDHCTVVEFGKPFGYSKDRKCRVYIYALPAGADGLTLVYPPPNNDEAILAVRNRYLDSNGPCSICRMQISAVHEFFHAVQYAYRPGVRRRDTWHWWREATATFMEDAVFPGSMEYIPYLYQWFDQPHISLDTRGASHEYGSALFCRFLTERYDRDIIRQVWEEAGQANSPFEVIDSILLADHKIPFASSQTPDAMTRFVLTNYFLTSKNYFYNYGGIYREKFQHTFVEHYCNTYPFQIESRLDHLAARYYIFKPAANNTKLEIKLQVYLRTGEPCPLKGVVVSSLDGKIIGKQELYLKSHENGVDGIRTYSDDIIIQAFGPRQVDEVLFVVINCSWGGNERNIVRYSLTAEAS